MSLCGPHDALPPFLAFAGRSTENRYMPCQLFHVLVELIGTGKNKPQNSSPAGSQPSLTASCISFAAPAPRFALWEGPPCSGVLTHARADPLTSSRTVLSPPHESPPSGSRPARPWQSWLCNSSRLSAAPCRSRIPRTEMAHGSEWLAEPWFAPAPLLPSA